MREDWEDGMLARMGRSSDSPAPLATEPTDPSMGHWLRAESTLGEETAFPWEICF